MSVWYLDSSAIVKLAVAEPESAALLAWRNSRPSTDALMTCELTFAEVIRAVRRANGDVDVARAHLDSLQQLTMDKDLMLAAALLDGPGLRTLDAIHLAAALAAEDELAAVVTYDDRMAAAARELGLEAVAPGSDKPTSRVTGP